MKLGGLISVVAGLILLGLCASQWSSGTGSTMSRALTDFNGGDRSDLASLQRGAGLNDTAEVGIEGVAGVVWLAIGAVLLKKAANAQPRGTASRRMPTPRR